VIPLEDILGNTAHEWNECIAAAQAPSTQVKRFEKIFAHFVQSQPGRYPVEPHAVLWLRQLPTMQVSKLAQRLGYSPRHFQRKLNEWVGFSPSLYKRISRFEKALEAIQNLSSPGRVDWSALAISCGYSDQAHFIRDFREFAGQTPAAYLGTF
jgi:AraC-like DNA-binding protein